ncbi:synapse-associated protein 1-like [Tropilaelaps mercedesae]|uniref:Synapse-associated protein 1-like n=1 Tax=Tropilaelaps mercedesae TaxID=418985 RepID=A0A1V9X2Y0_9ACAR|nr:synapse-associated protein 1-like [Tropilaelaps mercedesae]
MEGAKSFGSFLFSVANKAGKTVTETATKVKTAVEENVSIECQQRPSAPFFFERRLASAHSCVDCD